MKLTREKVVQLSHRIMGAVDDLDEVEIFEDRNTIRQEIVRALTDLLHEEERIDETVRQRITSQKRTIPEGSAEWDILYRKCYADEMRKLGVTWGSAFRP